ncbi:MAG: rbsA [Marmoricola sp.]|nr:rbsA [Marmoricola sp.]
MSTLTDEKPWVAPAPVINAEHVSMTFPAQRALDDVSLQIVPGEVHALLGENGSGKSTLIRILSGYHTPDPGSVLEIQGEQLPFGSLRASHAAGLRFVHQHLALINEFNAVENIALDSGFGRPKWIDWEAQAKEAERLLARLNVEMDIWRPLSEARPVERSAVAIARAINTDSGRVSCVVLDEPTSRLPEPEVEQLFSIIHDLRRDGIAVLYVTHRLDEVTAIADRVTVLRDGKKRGTVQGSDIIRERLVELIVGEAIAKRRATHSLRHESETDRCLLRLEGFSAGRVDDVSFTLREGEILGVVGLAGSGHEDIARALIGAIPREAGSLWVGDTEVRSLTPRKAVDLGIVLALSNTVAGSAVKEFSVSENLTMSSLSRYKLRLGLIRRRPQRRDARKWIEDLDVRPSDPDATYGRLSGGNQQKVILGRSLNCNPKVLLLENPTAGVDVGARQIIYQRIIEQAKSGLAVLICATDLEDVTSTCHRVLVIRAGKVVAVVEGDYDERRLMSLAANGGDGDPPRTSQEGVGAHD